jgi:hypothetical protein
VEVKVEVVVVGADVDAETVNVRKSVSNGFEAIPEVPEIRLPGLLLLLLLRISAFPTDLATLALIPVDRA